MVQCIGIISPIEIEGCSACLRMWQLFGAYRAELQADQKAQPPEDMVGALKIGRPFRPWAAAPGRPSGPRHPRRTPAV